MATSLYIHIPFCNSKCDYCSFSSYPGLQGLYKPYVDAVKVELRQLAERLRPNLPLETVFFGGGTPTVLPAADLVEILELSFRLFGHSENAEISIEANPGTIDQQKIDELKKGGFNRLSIGVQSFSEKELTLLGRRHTPKNALDAYRMAREAGFDNISLDLMYGLCGQDIESWQQTLQTVIDLGPDHLSMYQLTVEEGTPFNDLLISGALELPDEEIILAMDALNVSACGKAGLLMYEISNFARSGKRCRHNINYWQNNEYMAVGSGAVSYLDGERARRVSDPAGYCQKVLTAHNIIIERERLSLEASFRETVIMGLRMTEGVSIARLRDRYGIDPTKYYGDILKKLITQRLVELTPTHLRVTTDGRIFSNTILAELV